MGKKKICPKCNREFKDSKMQRLKRRGFIGSLKGIKVAGIQEMNEDTKDFCYECFEKELRSHLKPFAQELGKSAENW